MKMRLAVGPYVVMVVCGYTMADLPGRIIIPDPPDGAVVSACDSKLVLSCPEYTVVTANIYGGMEVLTDNCTNNLPHCLFQTAPSIETNYLWRNNLCEWDVVGLIINRPVPEYCTPPDVQRVLYLTALDFKCVHVDMLHRMGHTLRNIYNSSSGYIFNPEFPGQTKEKHHVFIHIKAGEQLKITAITSINCSGYLSLQIKQINNTEDAADDSITLCGTTLSVTTTTTTTEISYSLSFFFAPAFLLHYTVSDLEALPTKDPDNTTVHTGIASTTDYDVTESTECDAVTSTTGGDVVESRGALLTPYPIITLVIWAFILGLRGRQLYL